MKNLFRSLLAAAILFGAAACTTEDISTSVVGNGDPIEVTFTADLGTMGSRTTTGTGENVNKLTYNVYDASNDALLSDLCGTADRVNGVFKFDLVMIKGMTYDIVLWAECETNEFNAYEVGADGKTVTVNYDGAVANDERYDAFYKFVEGFDPTAHTPSFTLTRPLAQLNVATDDKDDVEDNGISIKTCAVEVLAYNSFNIEEGTVSDQQKETFSVANVVGGDLNGNATYEYLAVNYLFVPTTANSTALTNVKYTFTGQRSDNSTVTFTGTEYNDVPLKSNHRTNILGALLTKPTDFVVDIKADFGTPDEVVNIVNVASATDLQEAIDNAPTGNGESTEIILDGDINLNDLFAAGTFSTRAATLPLVIPAEKNIILNLNGKTINVGWENESAGKHYYAFENHGTLTITGAGIINARGNFNYGTMVLNDATINAIDGNGGYAVRNYEGAEFTMNGGTLATTLEDDNQVNNGGYDATTLRIDAGATATINDGVINNICDFTMAIDNYGTTTVNGGEFTSIHSTVWNEGTMTIDGGSFTCNGLEGITAHCLVAENTSLTTVNGGTFNGKDNYNGFNIDACKGSVVTINGGNFLPVHSGSLYGEGTITVYGGTFFDNVKEERLAEGYVAVKNSDDTYSVLKNATPDSVEAFIAAVAEGGNIVLQSDINVAEPIVVAEGKTVVIDLNGKTIIGTMHKSVGAVLKNEGTLTVKNGTISSTANNGGSAIANSGTAVVEGATLNGAPNADGSWPAYTVNNTGVLTINTSAITSFHGSVASYNDGALVTLNNSTIDMAGIPGFTNHGIYTYSNGAVVVNGGTYENKATDQNSTGGSVINGAVTVNAGTFTGRIENYYGNPVLKGGTFSVKPNARFVSEGYLAVQNGNVWNVVKGVKVNNAVELLAAVNQIADGDTITLSADFSFTTEEGGRYNNGGWWDGLGYSGDKSFTLDLNGHTLGNDGALNDYLVWFKNDGEKPNTITIKNGTLDAGTTAYCALCTSSSNKQTITVNLENVNLINNNSNGSTVKVRGGAVLNVKAGTKITGKNSYLGIECVASTTNIYDGAEIYMNGTSSYNGCLVGACGMGVVNVYGGYGKGVKGGFIAMTSGGTINVAGGEWIANTDGTIGNNSNVYVLTAQNNKYESGYAGASIINVTGGTLRGGMDAWILNDVTIEKAELNISGGNFNANPTHYLTDGATAAESNGIWTITK